MLKENIHKKMKYIWCSRHLQIQSTLVISKLKGPTETLPRYPYFDISDFQNWEKYKLGNQILQMNM